MRHKSIIVFFLASCAISVNAAEWKIDPALTLSGGYVDNLSMSTANEVSTAEATLTPSAIFSVATPTTGASGELRFDFHRYEEDSDLNENNTQFRIDTHHRMERARLGMNLTYTSDTTLDTQLEETGLVFDRIRRERLIANPSWNWLMSERTSLLTSYNYIDVDYKNASGTGLADYTLHNGALKLSHVLSPRASALITLAGTRSENQNDVQSTNSSLQAGFSYNFSETLSTALYGGTRYTEVDYSSTSLVPIFSGTTLIGFVPLTRDVSKSDWGGTFSANLTKKFLRGETGLSASRDISNSINGQPIQVDRADWKNVYRFSETLSASLNLSYYHSKSSNAVGQQVDRNYYQARPEFSWRFRRFWYLSGSYRFSKQTFANTGDDAVQNAAYLTLTYHWPRIAVSR